MDWVLDLLFIFISLTILIGGGIVAVRYRWVNVRWERLLMPDEQSHYAELELKVAFLEEARKKDAAKITEMEAAREISWKEHRRETSALSSVIARLEEENRQFRVRVDEVEKQAGIAPKVTTTLPSKPLLLILGAEPGLWDTDRQSIGRAGILFQRITNATKLSIESELQARRQDGTLYPWIHVTSHADENGIHLADGVAEAMWWYDTFRGTGIKVVFLAACKTNHVASALAGLVTVVFVNNEEIENKDAGAFTYAFWRRMKEHGDARRAYDQAIIEVPQVSEFTDIRTG